MKIKGLERSGLIKKNKKISMAELVSVNKIKPTKEMKQAQKHVDELCGRIMLSCDGCGKTICAECMGVQNQM